MRMFYRLVLLLLPAVCVRSSGQRLDHDSWAGQAAEFYGGLCRYGNGVECCWGWRRTDGGRCQPHCQQGCKHGECVGPDRCRCHPGYTGKACNQDLNECGVKPRPCKQRCMNTPGSFKCYCSDGFSVQPDGSCRNARTCYHANCQYGCEVIKGSVRCTCPSPGLRLGPDRRTCVDIDECHLGGAVCPRRRKCVNTFGSYMCKCHLGFKLTYINGRYACIDKDTRPFCSLNPASPKCRCKEATCTAVLKVTVEPQTPATTTTPITTATTAVPTTTTATPKTTTSIATTASPIPATTPTTTTPTTTTPTTTTPMTTTPTTTTPTTTIPTTTTPTTTTPTTTTPMTTTPTTTTPTTTTPTTTTPTTTTPTTTTPTTTTPTTTTPTTTTPTTTTPTTTTPTTTTPTTTPPTTTTPMTTTPTTTTPTTTSPTTTTPTTTTPMTTIPTTTTTTTTTPTTTTPTTTTPTTTTPTTTAPTTTTPTTTTPTTTTPTITTPIPTTPTTTTPMTTTPTITTPIPTTPMTTTATLPTTVPSTTLLVTTTVNNRINNEVTQRQRGDVHIPRDPNQNQVWEFDIELGVTADDAKDDPAAGALRCTFTRGLCDWMSDREGDLHWEAAQNPAGGRYLSVPKLKAGQRSIRGARLAVQIAPRWRHSDLCFSFSHWLTGHHVGVMQLFIRKAGRDQRYSPALWSRTGGHGWRHTEVTLTTHSLDKVLLKAERRKGRQGLIAVDDVTLRPGPCR